MTTATRRSAIIFGHVETMAEVREVRTANPVNPGNSGNDQAECVIACVAFFYEEGKGGENYRLKNKFRCRVNREERRLSKRLLLFDIMSFMTFFRCYSSYLNVLTV